MDTKQRIMETSLSLFLKKGFDSVSMREIKEAADITSGGFYHYFDSKKTLITEIQKEYFFRHHTTAMKKIKDLDVSFEKKTRLMMEYVMRYDHDTDNVDTTDQKFGIDMDYYTLYLEGIRRNKKEEEAMENFNRELVEICEKIIDDGKKNSEIKKEIGTKELAVLLISILKGTIEFGAYTPGFNILNTYEDTLNLLLDNILVK